MVDCLRNQLIPPASLLVSRRGFSRAWKPGSEPVGAGGIRAGGILMVIQTWITMDYHGLPFSPMNYVFEIYLFHTINSIYALQSFMSYNHT